MALVRGVICLSLSDWAPAVAPSLAPLHSARPRAPHLSQMGGWMDGRMDGGRGKQERQGRGDIKKKKSSPRSHQAGIVPLCAVKKGFGERHQKTCRATGRASHMSESQERAWCLQNELMTIGFFLSFFFFYIVAKSSRDCTNAFNTEPQCEVAEFFFFVLFFFPHDTLIFSH